MSLLLFLSLAAASSWLTLSLIRRIRQPALRWAAIVLALLMALPVLFAFGASSAHVVNNWRLTRFAAQLFDYPLPPGARELTRTAEVGVLTGNGDHCDFVARREIEVQLPIEAVRAYYASLELRPAIGNGAGAGCRAVEVTSRSDGRYVITAVDAPYEGIFDFRCH